jgi:hypothetical protein
MATNKLSTQKLETFKSSELLGLLRNFTYSEEITNEDLDYLMDTDIHSDVGQTAALTAILRELEKRNNV